MKNQKAINFDLDTKKLKEVYPKNISQAYYEIRFFLESRGFEHRQGSVYVSKEPMSMTSIDDLMEDMGREMPWISSCAKEVDVTNVGSRHSMLATLSEGALFSMEEKGIDETNLDIDITDDFFEIDK